MHFFKKLFLWLKAFFKEICKPFFALPRTQQRAFVLTFVVGCCVAFALTHLLTRPMHSELDISMRPINAPKRKLKGKVWLISYAAGGQWTNQVLFKNRNFLNYSAIGRGVDAVINYGRQDLDATFYQNNKALLDRPRGGGYWLWKPYIILKTLNMVPENDVVVYMDAGSAIAKDITPLVNLLAHKDLVLFQSTPGQTAGTIKRDALYLTGLDDEKYLKKTRLSASFLAVKNTAYTRGFVKKWLTYMCDPRIPTDAPSTILPEYPMFRYNAHDEAVLTCCYFQEMNKPNFQTNPRIFIYPRTRVCMWQGFMDSIIGRPRKWKPNRGYEHARLAGKLSYDYFLHHRRREDTLTLTTRFLRAIRHPYMTKPTDPNIKEADLDDTNGLAPGEIEKLD